VSGKALAAGGADDPEPVASAIPLIYFSNGAYVLWLPAATVRLRTIVYRAANPAAERLDTTGIRSGTTVSRHPLAHFEKGTRRGRLGFLLKRGP
jgi:hypothetical protein